MNSHDNGDWNRNYEDMLRRLSEKADRMTEEGSNTITAGAAGEDPISSWNADRMSVKQMPDDEHGVARISIGGVLDSRPGPWGYVVFRGDRDTCLKLLKRAVRAMEPPKGQ